MKILTGILFFIFLTSSLSAYPRCIILSSFKYEKDAQKKFSILQKKRTNLLKFANDNNFEINLRKSGNYFIITAEPFYDKSSLDNAMKTIKVEYESSFVSNYTAKKKIDKIEKVVEVKKIIEVEKTKKPAIDIVKNNQVMKNIKQNTQDCSWIFGCD